MLTVSLKNYRQFLSTNHGEPHAAAFLPGLTIVTGPNGAGKSNLIESVEYCLFGPQRRSRGTDERSDGAAGDLEVSCSFEIDGRQVAIQRCGRKALLSVDGTVIALKPNAVEEELGRQLGGITREDYERIYVALQGNTAGLVEARPGDRLKAIERILKFDVLRKAVDSQKQRRDAAKHAVRAQGERVIDELKLTAEDRSILQDAYRANSPDNSKRFRDDFLRRSHARMIEVKRIFDEASQRREAADQTVAVKTREQNQASADDELAQEQVQELDALEQQFRDYQTEIRACREREAALLREVRELEHKCETAEGFSEDARRYHELEQRMHEVQLRLEDLRTIKERHETRLRAHERVDALVDRVELYAELPQQLERANVNLPQMEEVERGLQVDPTLAADQGWHSSSALLSQAEVEAKEALAALGRTDANSECPTCERPLRVEERTKLCNRFRAQVERELPRRRAELAAQRKCIDGEREGWRQRKQEAEQAVVRARQCLGAAQRQSAAHDEIAQQLDEAKNELARVEREWDQLRESGFDPDEPSRLEMTRSELDQEAKLRRPNVEVFNRLPELRSDMLVRQEEATVWHQKAEKFQIEQNGLEYSPEFHGTAKEQARVAAAAFVAAERALGDAREKRERCHNEENAAAAAAASGERELDLLQKEADELELDWKLLALLDGFKDHYFTANTRLVAVRTTQLLLQAVPDGSITGVEFGAGGQLDYLDISHAPRPVERLSGGERALLGLCLRLALAERALRLVPSGRLDFLFLDEVLSALDDERRDGVQRVLDDVLRQGIFRHIIMITHLDAVKDGWRGETLEVRKLEGKRSVLVAGNSTGGIQEIEIDPEEDSRP